MALSFRGADFFIREIALMTGVNTKLKPLVP